ncbi:hypothetical protein RB195_002947 [Necator americanus]
MRQGGPVRAAGKQELTSELAKLCMIKENLKARRPEPKEPKGRSYRGGKEHSLRPSRIRQSKSEDESSLEPEGNNHSIEQGNEENHSQVLFCSFRHPCPLASSPSERRRTCQRFSRAKHDMPSCQ